MKSVFTSLFSGLLASAALAAPFAVPAEAIPPFQRAMLPIDADSISRLSSQLVTLSEGAPFESAEHRRATAQSLALALALDPENAKARERLSEIAGGRSAGEPDEERLGRAKARIWDAYGWLASPEAGTEGNRLAGLVADAVCVLDSKHPTALSLRDSPERGDWEGWVAPLSSFAEKKPEEPQPQADLDATAHEKGKGSLPAPGIKSGAASIGAVLSVYDEAAGTFVLKPTTVSMKAAPYRDSDGESDLRIAVRCPEGYEEKVYEDVSLPIAEALGKMNGSRLPAGIVRISTGPGNVYSHKRNGNDLTGPGLMLANAAVTGLNPEATIIARLDGSGGIALPEHFWLKLGKLAGGAGGRLIVPASAEGYVTAMLALEKPEFLFEYEVLAASSAAEAAILCAKEPDEAHAAVFAKFKEIKDKSGTLPLGSYLANHFVRERLAEIAGMAPYHLSAKLLAIQGAGERPRALSQKILAAEVYQAIHPIRSFEVLDIYLVTPDQAESMKETYQAVRTRLDGLDRYAGMRDRDLVAKGRDVAATLRSLYRFIGGRGEMWEKYEEIEILHKAMVAANREFRAELSELTGDPLPQDK